MRLRRFWGPPSFPVFPPRSFHLTAMLIIYAKAAANQTKWQKFSPCQWQESTANDKENRTAGFGGKCGKLGVQPRLH